MEECNYCYDCGSELKPTGCNYSTGESFFICPGCNNDYKVTIKNDYTALIEVEKQK